MIFKAFAEFFLDLWRFSFFLIVDFVTQKFLNFTTVQNFAQKEMGAES